MEAPNPKIAPDQVIPTLLQMYWAFCGVTMIGFGGVLPFARRMVVEQKRWLNPDEFNRVWSLCAIFPGPNVLNLGIILGQRFHGFAGAAVAVLAILGGPVLVVIVLGVLYGAYGDRPEINGMLQGMVVAAAGLIFATVYKMATPLFNWRSRPALLFTALTFVGIAVLHLSLPLVFLALLPFSVFFEWRKF